jgi:hypothetical protein
MFEGDMVKNHKVGSGEGCVRTENLSTSVLGGILTSYTRGRAKDFVIFII